MSGVLAAVMLVRELDGMQPIAGVLVVMAPAARAVVVVRALAMTLTWTLKSRSPALRWTTNNGR